MHLLPDDLAGRDVIELGCGTAYVSAWLARRGARVTGIDNSPAQLETARRLQASTGSSFPLLLGNAEEVPLPDASFDLAISEYGAALWADPYRWIPEAARLLRPGGELIFLTNGLLCILCVPDTEAEGPATDRLRRPYFGMHRNEWPGSDGVEFHLGYGDWIRLLRANGFEVIDLIELRPPPEARHRLRPGSPPSGRGNGRARRSGRRASGSDGRVASVHDRIRDRSFAPSPDAPARRSTSTPPPTASPGMMATRFSRVADIVNQLTSSHLVDRAGHGQRVRRSRPPRWARSRSSSPWTRCCSWWPASRRRQARPEMRIPKRAVRAQLALPPFRITGAVHVPAGQPPDRRPPQRRRALPADDRGDGRLRRAPGAGPHGRTRRHPAAPGAPDPGHR